MKYVLILSFLMGGILHGQNLDDYLWKKRVIVLFKGGDFNSAWEEQHQLLKSYASALRERDMLVISPDEKTKSKWLQKFNLKNDFNGLVLIGKDGGLKLKEEYIVEPTTLFSLVDSMPMRRAEIKRNKKHPN